MPDRCLFISCIIVYNCYAETIVFQQSKNVKAKCTENLSPPPCILYLLAYSLLLTGGNTVYSSILLKIFCWMKQWKSRDYFTNFVCLGQFNGDSTSYGQGGTPSDQQFYNEELIKETLILLYTQVNTLRKKELSTFI